jgi:polar amino acid transport system substrate-binding protein
MRTNKHIHLKQVLLLCVFCLFVLTSCSEKGSAETELKVNSADDLAGKVIGVQLGTTGDIYVSDYEGDEAGTTVERYNKGNDAIQALKQDKVDAVVIDEEPAKAFVAANSELVILDEEFANEDYAICGSKQTPELTAAINDALAALSADGTLENIRKNYTGSDDEKGQFPYEKKDVDRPNGKLVCATNAAFKPYEYYENGVMTGFDVDMMQAICDELGMELVMEDMEFDSIISAVQSGKADVGASGMTVTEDRLKNIDFTDSYTNAKQVILVKDPTAASEKLTITEKFYQNFIKENRWQYLTKGLLNTLIITVFAAIIGIILGFLIAIIRAWHDKNGGLNLLNFICRIYLTVIRGTPAMIQLLIIYYVIFASVNVNKIIAAFIAFGLNSAAYVAEIVRSGIMSIDNGQFEAGRSLGLNFTQTMRYIIMPQAFKNVLPALANEFIVLIKETSISGYIGLADLTKGGDIIRSLTYEPLFPLLAVAIIYLIIVVLLTAGVNKLERRLANNERR